MKNIKNIPEFAKIHGVSRQVIEGRIRLGWKFGMLDGEKVMYSPKAVHKVIEVQDDAK